MRPKTAVIIAGILFIGFIFFALNNPKSGNRQDDGDYLASPNSTVVKKVNAQEVNSILEDEQVFVIDVHIPEQEHLPGTDAFIPYDEIDQHLSKLPQDKTTPILLYCRSGSMSEKASIKLLEMGYTNVSDLVGGINAYREVNSTVDLTPESQDLGTVVYGDVAKTEFKLTNFTPQPLKITGVSTSCTCTSAEIEKESLSAYESVNVNVSFDPAVHKDDTDLGNIIRTIYIETDNINFPRLQSEITANVVKN